MPDYIGDIKLRSVVTLGGNLHHQMSKAVVDMATAAEKATNASDKMISATVEVNPYFKERTLHPMNYRSATILKTAMNLELRQVANAPILLGDFMPTARHEVIYGVQGKRYFDLAFTSSWPSLHFDNQKVSPARYLSHIFTAEKFETTTIRHQGLAKTLLQNVETFAREMGEKFVVLSTFPLRENFFKKLGYEVVVKAPNETMMAKKLFALALPVMCVLGLTKQDKN